MENQIEKTFEQVRSPEIQEGVNLENVIDLKTAWDSISWQTKTFLYEIKYRMSKGDIEALRDLEMIPERIVPNVVKETVCDMVSASRGNKDEDRIAEGFSGLLCDRDCSNCSTCEDGPELIMVN